MAKRAKYSLVEVLPEDIVWVIANFMKVSFRHLVSVNKAWQSAWKTTFYSLVPRLTLPVHVAIPQPGFRTVPRHWANRFPQSAGFWGTGRRLGDNASQLQGRNLNLRYPAKTRTQYLDDLAEHQMDMPFDEPLLLLGPLRDLPDDTLEEAGRLPFDWQV